MIIEWENSKTLLVDVTDFSVTIDLFKNGVHISIDFLPEGVDRNITRYIDKWRDSNEIKSIIINKKSEYFLLEKGYPKMIYIDNELQSTISSGEFSFKSYRDISRKFKINRILSESNNKENENDNTIS
jgi:hypothetical protein